MENTRRAFLKQASLVSMGFLFLDKFAHAVPNHRNSTLGFGPLQYKEGDILALPAGFQQRVISRQGGLMADGLSVPGAFDGMGAFYHSKDEVLLVRNHELSPGSLGAGPWGRDLAQLEKRVDPRLIYDLGGKDRLCVGGTTTLVYNQRQQRVTQEYLSLTGTVRNCAGGVTPWNSWITCEETELGIGDEGGKLLKNHGFNFEVPATTKIGLVEPYPIKAMGRFVHEAVAVQPKTGIVYQTEDAGNGVFYRYLPNQYGNLHAGGKLQCLAIKAWTSADTRNWHDLPTDKFPAKQYFEVEWIDLDDVEAPDNDLRLRAYTKGGTRFAAAEGIWYGQDELYFACTNGGHNHKGQIFKYVPSPYEGTPREHEQPGKLMLFLEPNDVDVFQNCDNLTIAPWGDVIICEDKDDARIVGITQEGKTYVLAKNITLRESEFAGPVFSPSGDTLFVNVQSPGVTIAIAGPWKKKLNA